MNKTETKILKINPDNINMDRLSQAADIIAHGGLVAFPTETVYGLGADAMNEKAVLGIFTAKGRPSDNPLIVHIATKDDVKKLAAEIPETAEALMNAFWPGPLTLIFKKTPAVSYSVTAGLNTVAVRMPDHPIALALIRGAGTPIAAPSANTSGKPSPTIAEHVIEDLTGRVDAIIEGGNANVGLESTVLDITADPPAILRPGGVTPDQLLLYLREVAVDPAISGPSDSSLKPKAPGMKYRHYSPKAEVLIVNGDTERVPNKIKALAERYSAQGKKVGIMVVGQNYYSCSPHTVLSPGDRDNPSEIAANLFATLREFDALGVDIIIAEGIEAKGIGLAVMNRLNKAAAYNIVTV